MDPFDNIDDGQILEGFLCPICRKDLKTPERLTDHVEKDHAEDQDVLKSLKDIFSIAKRKIKINFDETSDLAKSIDSTLRFNATSTQMNVFNNMKQDVGIDCSHFSSFSSIRTPRLDRYASETNKLLIRLSKLLKNRPTDPVQQKLHEQKTVPWLDGKSVKLCPVCAKRFHIAKRQHHCRLCGSIMCNDCSQFLPLSEAINLVNVSSLDNSIQQNNDETEHSTTENENSIRSCDHCLRLLDNRKEMQESRSCRPDITIIYTEIQDLKKSIFPDIDMYLKMVNSLYDGESIYTLNDVSALRGKIGHAAELIDVKSKRILAIKCIEGTREEALKKAVRLACIQFIKDKMLSIPQLPVEETIKELQKKRRMETEQRIEREQRLAMEAYEKYGLVESRNSSMPINESYASRSAVTTIDNWSGHQASNSSGVGSDPLIEQINIIKGYIKQARAAMRFDEIETLEINLRELQNEIYQRQQI